MTRELDLRAATPAFGWALLAIVVAWLMTVSWLMVADVWDESRILDVVQEHNVVELLTTNWKQEETEGTVLFRPLPMLLFTGVAAPLDRPEITWRVLRGVNALLVLAAGALLLDGARRVCGREPARELVAAVIYLFSGSVLITAGWFANAFDAMALFCVALATQQLVRGRPRSAGAALGIGLFCKEVAGLGFVLLLVLWCTRTVRSRDARRALVVAALLLVAYLALRTAVVAPGSGADLRPWSLDGTIAALWRLPAIFWWQTAVSPVPWAGWTVVAATIVGMRSWRAAAGAAVVYAATAVLYGPILDVAAGPLISSGNFAGRLFLVPAAVLLFLIAVHGRRGVVVLLLVPVLWGAVLTAQRHHRFQIAYQELYRAGAASDRPLRVFCRFYDPVFSYEFRNLVIGRLRDARWQFTADGELIRRHAKPTPPDAGPD